MRITCKVNFFEREGENSCCQENSMTECHSFYAADRLKNVEILTGNVFVPTVISGSNYADPDWSLFKLGANRSAIFPPGPTTFNFKLVSQKRNSLHVFF